MAMEHLSFIDDFPIQTSIYIGFSIATKKWENLASSTVDRTLDLPGASTLAKRVLNNSWFSDLLSKGTILGSGSTAASSMLLCCCVSTVLDSAVLIWLKPLCFQVEVGVDICGFYLVKMSAACSAALPLKAKSTRYFATNFYFWS